LTAKGPLTISSPLAAGILAAAAISRPTDFKNRFRLAFMANTSSARKAARKIARRTEVNKARRSRMRSALRKVEEAIASGDQNKALDAMKQAEPALMRAARQGQLHRNTANRKVSRLTRQITKIGK
jgi:small subunit ribosomal protein S20